MLVSIIVPCYNQGRFLNESLKSVLDQTYSNWECIIVDDGSIDGSAAIAKEWIDKDCRFLYFNQENTGVSAARNYGISKAKGEWIQFLDADDYLNPSKLSETIRLYEKDNRANFIVTNFRHFTMDVNVSTPPFCTLQKQYLTLDKMLYEWNQKFSLPIHTVMLKKELIGNTLFPKELTAQEDWFFWVAILKKNCVTYFIDDPLVLYRSHAESRIKSKSIIQDQLKVYSLFKQLLTMQEHYQLSVKLIERYLINNALLNNKIKEIKNSNSFQTGMMIKKILRSFGTLKIGRKLFSLIRTFKKPIN